MKYNILITGACGVTSRSVVRSLKISDKFSTSRFVGTGVFNNKFSLYEGLHDVLYKVPNYDNKEYRDIIEKVIKKEKIDVAIIIPELEVCEWAKENFSTKYIVPPYNFCTKAIDKLILYNDLKESGLVPNFALVSRQDVMNEDLKQFDSFPLWIRDFSAGSTSGKGAFKINNYEEAKAWVIINSNIERFLISEFLSGGNYACHLLYKNGELKKIATYQRLEYFMKKVVPSGISGNISEGKLVNNEKVSCVAIRAIEQLNKKYNTIMNGIVAVDLKCDSHENPFITEINIRHVAGTSAFALAGFNIAEYQLLCALDRENEIPKEIEKIFPKYNLILRDIDGLPIWVENYKKVSNESFL